MVYRQGTEAEDIAVPATGTFINDNDGPIYRGISPAGGPLGTAVTGNPANGSNRVESVSFREAGTYLVNLQRPDHFLDGMRAVVKVERADDD